MKIYYEGKSCELETNKSWKQIQGLMRIQVVNKLRSKLKEDKCKWVAAELVQVLNN